MKDQIETLPKIEIMIKGCSLSVKTLLSGMHHLTLCTSLPTKLPKYLLKTFFRTTKTPLTKTLKNKHDFQLKSFEFGCFQQPDILKSTFQSLILNKLIAQERHKIIEYLELKQQID